MLSDLLRSTVHHIVSSRFDTTYVKLRQLQLICCRRCNV